MPAIGILPLIELIGLGVSAGSAAYSGYESAQGSNAQTAAAQTAADTQAKQAAAQKQQAIAANLSNAQEKTGGSLESSGLTNLASLLAGYGGQTGGATTGSTTGNTTSVGLQDALTQLTQGTSPGGNFSGGSGQTEQGGDARFQLSQPFIS